MRCHHTTAVQILPAIADLYFPYFALMCAHWPKLKMSICAPLVHVKAQMRAASIAVRCAAPSAHVRENSANLLPSHLPLGWHAHAHIFACGRCGPCHDVQKASDMCGAVAHAGLRAAAARRVSVLPAGLQVHDATLSLQQAQAAAAEALIEKAEKPGRSKSKATRAIADGAADARLALLQEEARALRACRMLRGTGQRSSAWRSQLRAKQNKLGALRASLRKAQQDVSPVAAVWFSAASTRPSPP